MSQRVELLKRLQLKHVGREMFAWLAGFFFFANFTQARVSSLERRNLNGDVLLECPWSCSLEVGVFG